MLCSIAGTEAMSFEDFARRLPHTTFLDLTTLTDATDDAWEEEITGWDPRNTRDPCSSSSFRPHQSDATSHNLLVTVSFFQMNKQCNTYAANPMVKRRDVVS